jgi:predicted glycosyltransferase involved in capsule biosynthesis
MNSAIANSKYDYIIEIDGDIIMNKYFIEDHLNFAEKGCYLFGSRVNIQEQLLLKLFSKKIINFNLFSAGIKKRGRTIRFPFLMQFAKKIEQRSSKLRGCNMSFWKTDFIKINGFNEALVGWGIDDSEMIQRLHNIGIKGKRLKYSGIAYHIYHKEQSKSHLEINNEIEKETTEKKLTFIEKGINQYL